MMPVQRGWMLTGLFKEISVFHVEPETIEEHLKKIDELSGDFLLRVFAITLLPQFINSC